MGTGMEDPYQEVTQRKSLDFQSVEGAPAAGYFF